MIIQFLIQLCNNFTKMSVSVHKYLTTCKWEKIKRKDKCVCLSACTEEKNVVAAEENGADRDCLPVFTDDDWQGIRRRCMIFILSVTETWLKIASASV